MEGFLYNLLGIDIDSIYIWYMRNRYTRKEQHMKFDLFKAFAFIKSSHKSIFFTEKTNSSSCVRNILWVTV